MPKNRFVILSFLFLAWTIIVAHSIVPHHHHSENLQTDCSSCHSHNEIVSEMSEIHDCDHDCNDHACHFHVDVLTKISVDNIFIVDTENTFLNYLSFSEINKNNFNTNFVFEDIPKSNYLRGPPHKA